MPPTSAPPYVDIADFPGVGNYVMEIVPGGPGLVAVGYSEQARSDCDDERFARVWTSADGLVWSQSDLGDQRAWFTSVVPFSDLLFAFANAGGYCHGGNVADVWQSPDGSTWTEVASGVASGHASWCSAAATESGLAAGVFVAAGVGYEELWQSGNGTDWQRLTHGHDEPCDPVSINSAVISFEGRTPAQPWLLDGAVWTKSMLATDYDSSVHPVAFNGQMLATTRSCCGLPMQQVGLVLKSDDGRGGLLRVRRRICRVTQSQ